MAGSGSSSSSSSNNNNNNPKPSEAQAQAESYAARQRRHEAASILDSTEMLLWYASARNESVAQTRRYFTHLVLGVEERGKEWGEEWEGEGEGERERRERRDRGKGKARERERERERERDGEGRRMKRGSAGVSRGKSGEAGGKG